MPQTEPSVEECCRQAELLLSQRDVQGAIELYESVIRNHPEHIGAHESLAAVCFARKDHSRAVELFKRVVALDPRRIEPLVNLGAAYNRNGQFAEAIKTLRLAVSRDRRCAAAYYNLGFAQRSIHQLSMAVSAFKEAIRLEPEMWEAYINLGQTLLEMKNPTQAALNFERAVQLRPESTRARQGLITARHQVEDAKHAISPFGRLVNMDEVAEQNKRRVTKTAMLSAEDQVKDRMESYRLAKEFEQCAVVLFQQIKTELSPAILNMSRLANETDPKSRGQAVQLLQASSQRFQKMSQIVASKLGELRLHQQAMQALSTGDD